MQSGEFTGNLPKISASWPINSEMNFVSPTILTLGKTFIPNFAHTSYIPHDLVVIFAIDVSYTIIVSTPES